VGHFGNVAIVQRMAGSQQGDEIDSGRSRRIKSDGVLKALLDGVGNWVGGSSIPAYPTARQIEELCQPPLLIRDDLHRLWVGSEDGWRIGVHRRRCLR
jgi:hypothetical protein